MSEEYQYDAYCTDCDKPYDVSTSDAVCDYLYCSKACEIAHAHGRIFSPPLNTESE